MQKTYVKQRNDVRFSEFMILGFWFSCRVRNATKIHSDIQCNNTATADDKLSNMIYSIYLSPLKWQLLSLTVTTIICNNLLFRSIGCHQTHLSNSQTQVIHGQSSAVISKPRLLRLITDQMSLTDNSRTGNYFKLRTKICWSREQVEHFADVHAECHVLCCCSQAQWLQSDRWSVAAFSTAHESHTSVTQHPTAPLTDWS